MQLDPTLHMLIAPIRGRFVSAAGTLQLADVELPEPIARRPSPESKRARAKQHLTMKSKFIDDG